jgi:hypothetical protein
MARTIPIVPLKHRFVADPSTGSDPVFHGGTVLTNVQVQPVFWGAAWRQESVVARLNHFFSFIVTSCFINMLNEYSVAGQIIGPGSALSSLLLTDPEPGGGANTIDDSAIQQQIDSWVSAGTLPSGANAVYFVFLPPGVTVTTQWGSSCSTLCGYHFSSPNNHVYAVIPFVDQCYGCAQSTQLDTFTAIASHELAEAITDPIWSASQGGTGWWDDVSGEEIGDFCLGNFVRLGGFLVQRVWSNRQNACAFVPQGELIAQAAPLACFSWGATQATRLYCTGESACFKRFNNVNEVRWDNGWYYSDITGGLGIPAAAGSGLACFGWGPGQATRLYYIDQNSHVNEIGWGDGQLGWYNFDITQQLGGHPLASPGSSLTCFAWGSTQSTRLYYIDQNNHVNEIKWDQGWSNFDITQQLGGHPLANPRSGLTCFAWGPTQSTRLYYIDQKDHVNEIKWDQGWSNYDITQK